MQSWKTTGASSFPGLQQNTFLPACDNVPYHRPTSPTLADELRNVKPSKCNQIQEVMNTSSTTWKRLKDKTCRATNCNHLGSYSCACSAHSGLISKHCLDKSSTVWVLPSLIPSAQHPSGSFFNSNSSQHLISHHPQQLEQCGEGAMLAKYLKSSDSQFD